MSGADEDLHFSGDDSSFSSATDNELYQGRSLLWLCREGLMRQARQRFQALVAEGENDDACPQHSKQLAREVLQVGHDGSSALSEILMGGTSDSNAYALAFSILEHLCRLPNKNVENLLLQQPRAFNKRTCLHWACWGNASMDILRPLVKLAPQALLWADDRRSGERTPFEILQYYYFSNRNSFLEDVDVDAFTANREKDPRLDYLQRMTTSWEQYRLQSTIHLCANRYFAIRDSVALDTSPQPSLLTPFVKQARRQAKIAPKPWFALSVIGTLIQRELLPLAIHILTHVGGNQGKKRQRGSGRGKAQGSKRRTK